MSNYQIYIAKEDNGLFSAFSPDYNIAIEEKSAKKAFDSMKVVLREVMIEDVKDGIPVKKPKELSFDEILDVINEYSKDKRHVIVKDIDFKFLIDGNELGSIERINVTIPRYIKLLLEKAKIKPSQLLKKAALRELQLDN